jgi:hypothetical protein
MTVDALNLPADLRIAPDKAVQRIVEIAQPELVILFGSWAEGKAREDSDVDLPDQRHGGVGSGSFRGETP